MGKIEMSITSVYIEYTTVSLDRACQKLSSEVYVDIALLQRSQLALHEKFLECPASLQRVN